MQRKQILSGILGVAVVLSLGLLVYSNFVGKGQVGVQPAETGLPIMAEEPVPDTIEDMVMEIAGETELDAAALSAEAEAENSEIQADSQSLNDLSESYDTQSF